MFQMWTINKTIKQHVLKLSRYKNKSPGKSGATNKKWRGETMKTMQDKRTAWKSQACHVKLHN